MTDNNRNGHSSKTPAGAGHSPGEMVGEHSLGGAVSELYKQHPYKWSDLGPHHHTSDHDRHTPVIGKRKGG